jgi:hypothetical protein
VAAIGLIGFIGLLGTALARGEWARLAQATLALSAFAFGAYLLVIQLAVIGAVCQWLHRNRPRHDRLATVAAPATPRPSTSRGNSRATADPVPEARSPTVAANAPPPTNR